MPTAIPSSGGGGGTTGPVLVPLASAESTVLSADTALAQVRFDPADYATPPTAIALEAVGSVVSGVTGTLVEYTQCDGADMNILVAALVQNGKSVVAVGKYATADRSQVVDVLSTLVLH